MSTNQNSLRLTSVKLVNFRSYRDETLEFSTDSARTITIFHGSNSAGKTTIMNAIHWCLYGKEPHFINEGEGKPLVNQKALNDTKVGKSVEASVEMVFSNMKSPQYKIRRSLIAYRKTDQRSKVFNPLANGLIDSGFSIETEQSFMYVDKESGGWESAKDPNRFAALMDRLLPEKLSMFVFFNGEMLDKFFSALQTENIRNGIERVSGLIIVDEAIDHLKEMEQGYRKKAMAENSDTGYLNERKERLQTRLEAIREKLTSLKRDESALEKREKLIDEELKNNPEALLQNLELQLQDARRHKSSIQELLSKNREERRSTVTKLFAKVLLIEPLKQCLNVLQEAENIGLTPPPIDSNYLKERLSEQICICDRDLKKNSREYKTVEELLNRLVESDVATEAMSGRILIPELINSIQNPEIIIGTLNNYRIEREKYKKDFAAAEQKIEGIIGRLKTHDIEHIRKLGQQLEEVRNNLRNIRNEIAPLKRDEDTILREIEEIDVQADKAAEKSEKAKRWKARQDLAREVREALIQLREETLAEIRQKVERRTNEIFRVLIARRWQLDRIEISQDYRIKVLDKDGADNLKTLSAGQTLYLSLSFIAALREVTAINYPMVIDSPFGKVSGYERVWAAEDLPKYLPETQITFLVTDTEYTSDVSNILTREKIPSIRNILLKNQRIWKEFNLVLVKEDENSSRTEVKEVS